MTDVAQHWEKIEDGEQAKIALETYMNLDIAQFASGGDMMRIHDFARADIPVMIAAASGKLGTPDAPVFDLRDNRQNAILDLEPMALKKRLDENFDSARKALAWAGPHLAPEARKFLKLGDEGTFSKLAKILVEQRQAVHDRENTILMGYEINGKKVSIDAIPENDRIANEQSVKKDDQFLMLKNGDRVRVDVKIHNYTDETFNSWQTKYAVSNSAGERSVVSSNDISHGNHAYGVIMERQNRTYFVAIGTNDDNPEMPRPDGEAREIVGLDSGGRKFFENNIGAENLPKGYDATSMLRLSTMRENDGSEPHSVGEVHYRSTIGPRHQRGPIILQSMPWASGASHLEQQIAIRMIDIHIGRNESGPAKIVPGVNVENKPVERQVFDPRSVAIQTAALQMAL